MVLPFIGAGIASGIGIAAGLSLGPYIWPALTKPASYRLLHEEVDHDQKVPAPDHGLLVKTEYRDVLPLLEPWVTDPDYERTAAINRLTQTVWPTMTKAILDLIIQGDVYNTVLYPQLKAQVFDKFPFVEDIFLGPHSLATGKVDLRPNPWLADKLFNLGATAPRIGGMRVVPTADDEVLMETSMIWGSQATFDVSAVLRFGRLRLVVPIQVANISFKADVRVILRPLVEKFPCLGGVSISLLRVPTVDFSLKLIKGVDLMALPFVPQIVAAAMRVVLEPVTIPLLNKPLVPGLGLVLPNAAAFPVMPNFGLPAPPVGALRVTILRLEAVRGGDDLYCTLEIRRGRTKQTKTIDNNRNPEFNEEFALIIDTFENDTLRVLVYNDDMGWNDTCLSEMILPFGEVVGIKVDPKTGQEVTDFQKADFIEDCQEHILKLPLKKVTKKGLAAAASRAASRAASKSFTGGAKAVGAGAGATKSASKKTLSAAARFLGLSKKKKKDEPVPGTPPFSDTEGDGQPPIQPAQSLAPVASTAPAGLSRTQTAGRSSAVAGEGDGPDVGTITFKVEFIPFHKPEYDDIQAEKAKKAHVKDPYLSMFPAPPGRSLGLLESGGGGGGSGGTGSKLSMGVLTVQLIRCIDLAPEGAKDLATYVKMMVTNDIKDEVQVSTTILNETSPRWGDKFDFVLIPSNSELHLQVFNKTGMLGNLVGTLFRKSKEEKDAVMGKVMVRVEDVARNGRIKETWSLQDAERGYIELNLIWQPCHVSKK
ncbi:hypothetical protein HYH03_017169 [Edaphochlamys debaryana]|uniref:C2 domain-containing protein n=1 Tax=Edaphochlamys debaryana TaxID=47281 RepID=A0A836BPJ7_9CHLO|nr:hypothetical protein HYH03_017169 [Edaphochlamys debaryana]|eukprot:KAG2484002.1 hypothetical protein HYH03_017169 [Edaphochlamys debaryana]